MKVKIQALFVSAALVFMSLTGFVPVNVRAQEKSGATATPPPAATAPTPTPTSSPETPAASPVTPPASPETPAASQTEPIDRVVINVNQRRLPRIGVPSPLLKMIETSHSVNTSDAIRGVLVAFMSGPMIEVVPLDSRIPVQIEAEAKMKNCDLVLFSTVTLQKTGGTSRIGGFLKKIAPAAALIALTGGAGVALATAAQVSAGVAGEVTAEHRKKDKIIFEYRLVKLGGALPIVANTLENKAKEDSEDVLTPMLAENAEVIVIAALRYQAELLTPPKQNNQAPAQDNAQQLAANKANAQAVPQEGGGQ
ncbi:MAG TPA: hypothetical protein VGC87_16965 [Pyrinomonadaceae bacterium]|jgi:hypothetical protein